MPSPTRIVTARHPSRIPRPPRDHRDDDALPQRQAQNLGDSQVIARRPRPQEQPSNSTEIPGSQPELDDDKAARVAAADRVWRIVSGQERG